MSIHYLLLPLICLLILIDATELSSAALKNAAEQDVGRSCSQRSGDSSLASLRSDEGWLSAEAGNTLSLLQRAAAAKRSSNDSESGSHVPCQQMKVSSKSLQRDAVDHSQSVHHLAQNQVLAELRLGSSMLERDHIDDMQDLRGMSRDQLFAELQLAKDDVASLEALLANARRRGRQLPGEDEPEEVWKSTPGQRQAKIVILSLFCFLCAFWTWWTVHAYERDRDPLDEPWYHDNPCVTNVLFCIACLWLSFGVWIFTEILLFTDDHRHLTVIEAVYVNSQIITGVGYGDYTVSTGDGVVFMTWYALIAVALFATLTQHMIMWYIEMTGDAKDHEHDLVKMLAPIAACTLFGTVFYSYYPGEELDIAQSLNMSIITFLTVGFGDYTPQTEVGQVVAAIWMVVGVICTGKAIVDGTKSLFVHRQNLRSTAAKEKAFDQLDKTHKGYIDKVTFVGFELVQEGLEQHTIDNILAKFDEFDTEHDGTLTFEEFKNYVESVGDA